MSWHILFFTVHCCSSLAIYSAPLFYVAFFSSMCWCCLWRCPLWTGPSSPFQSGVATAFSCSLTGPSVDNPVPRSFLRVPTGGHRGGQSGAIDLPPNSLLSSPQSRRSPQLSFSPISAVWSKKLCPIAAAGMLPWAWPKWRQLSAGYPPLFRGGWQHGGGGTRGGSPLLPNLLPCMPEGFDIPAFGRPMRHEAAPGGAAPGPLPCNEES
jgi:hypothetical protein